MPEATDLLMRRGEVIAGFWIRRVASPPATRSQRTVRAEDNKENVPPPGYGGPSPWRRRRRTRKSPLPDWYPRTPLRDITAIVNALEKRRLRAQANRANVIRGREASPEIALISTLPQEPSVTDLNLLADSTPKHITTYITSSPVEHPLQTPSTSGESPINMLEKETEERLCRSIEQIEKIVKKNLKKTVKETSAKRVAQRRTLMSMR